MRARLLAAALAVACQPSPGETGSFTTAQPSTTAPASTGEGSTSGSGATVGGSGTSSSTSTGEVSTSSGSTGSTTLVLDVGSEKDVGDGKPPGCKGKIDFLFVISRHLNMASIQGKLIAAFPAFIETIKGKFADFDFHIMVVDGEKEWGMSYCTSDCPVLDCKVGQACCPVSVCPDCDPPAKVGDPCCDVPNYPCAQLGMVSACDETLGAGIVFPAGTNASNKPCAIAGGRRYLTNEQPNLGEAFECIARLGTGGGERLGESFMAAMQPSMNAPGGCNAGFLRDDALLMVTFIGGYDYDSKGEPSWWAAAALEAKSGDPGSIVMLNILDPECPSPPDRVCELVKMFPYHHVADIMDDDYGMAFDAATELVTEACAAFIPG